MSKKTAGRPNQALLGRGVLNQATDAESARNPLIQVKRLIDFRVRPGRNACAGVRPGGGETRLSGVLKSVRTTCAKSP
eukprot:5671178-Prymnesium_polylepis.1